MKHKYHEIVLLANLMDAQARLNDESRGRADLAASLYRRGAAGGILCCGWPYRDDVPMAIGDALRDYLLSQGLPTERLTVELRSRDTVGDAVFARLRLGPIPPLVVTSDYHADRAAKIFRFVYGVEVEVRGAMTPAADGRAASEQASLDAFHRTFAGVEPGDLDAIYARMLAEHPLYNGVSAPRFGS